MPQKCKVLPQLASDGCLSQHIRSQSLPKQWIFCHNEILSFQPPFLLPAQILQDSLLFFHQKCDFLCPSMCSCPALAPFEANSWIICYQTMYLALHNIPSCSCSSASPSTFPSELPSPKTSQIQERHLLPSLDRPSVPLVIEWISSSLRARRLVCQPVFWSTCDNASKVSKVQWYLTLLVSTLASTALRLFHAQVFAPCPCKNLSLKRSI